jgi:2-polyprenyl-6-methoxyphenol hydroxylase-like FAD-dependent oxidoreductase
MDAPVIIVGGGPVGIWIAYELRLAGVPVIVLDSDVEISSAMRGATIHSRTMEFFTMRGIHEGLLQNAGRLSHAGYGQLSTKVSFENQDSDYPCIVMQIQPRTTAVIQEHALKLGVDLRRGHTATAVSQTADSISVTVQKKEDGTTYELRGQYLVGADGADSLVRKTAGIVFEGESASLYGWGGDMFLREPPSPLPGAFWSPEGAVAIFPLPGGLFRVAGICPDNLGSEGARISTFEELRERVIRVTGKDFGMYDCATANSTSNASLLASRYREGRFFIAGDAAHRHSPAAGMGMNVGIQDAMNLGWKLAAVVNGWASPELLDTYESERRPVGQNLLQQTRAQTAITTLFESDGQGLREMFDDCLQSIPEFNDALAARINGLFVKYSPRNIDDHALVGARVPNLFFTDKEHTRLYPSFTSGRYLVLTLTEDRVYDEDIAPSGSPVSYSSRTLDRTATRDKRWCEVTALLIRPDGYVAWATAESEPDKLRKETRAAVEKEFIKKPE